MDTVRTVEKAIVADRRGEDVPKELGIASLGGDHRGGVARVLAIIVNGSDAETEPAPDRIPEPTPVEVPEPGPVEVPEPQPVEVPAEAPPRTSAPTASNP